METKANHVLIGTVTLLGALLIVALGLWSASYRADRAWQDFEIHFSQAVTGLASGSVVQYNGINVGSVRDLFLDPEDPSRVIAVVRVDADAPVRQDTTARLTINGLTGVAAIQLRGGSPESPVLVGTPSARPVIVAEESPLQRLIDQSEDIVSTASEIMLRLLDFINEENAERVAGTLDNIDRFTVALAGETDQIGAIIRNARDGSERANHVLDSLGESLEQLRQLTANLDAHVVERLPDAVNDLQVALDSFATVAQRIDQVLADNQQALSSFGNDTLAQLGPAVEDLRHLIRDLSRTSSRFERHPARFLLGGEKPEEFRPR